jgi:ABC-type antimicrobial peptide transport system permease subunit
VREFDPAAAVTRVRPMTGLIAESVGRPRFYLVLLGGFAAVAVVLAMAGLYGLMSYLVAQRTREIGIRMALGSTPERTRGLVLREGAWLVARGLAVGLLLAGWLTQLLVSQLFGVSPLDPMTWAAVTGLLLATAGRAMLIPAGRATRFDPLLAIRAE